jgi:hypothetical protein
VPLIASSHPLIHDPVERLVRLLAVLAVLLMPLGMAPAAAAAVHPQMAMDMPAGHCPEQAPGRDMKGGIAECTMACAGTLPATDLASNEPVPIARAPIQPTATQRLQGLHPDAATPPPKRS